MELQVKHCFICLLWMTTWPGLLRCCRFEEWGPRIKQLLDPSKETVVLCHHGVRSMQVCRTVHGCCASEHKLRVVGVQRRLLVPGAWAAADIFSSKAPGQHVCMLS